MYLGFDTVPAGKYTDGKWKGQQSLLFPLQQIPNVNSPSQGHPFTLHPLPYLSCLFVFWHLSKKEEFIVKRTTHFLLYNHQGPYREQEQALQLTWLCCSVRSFQWQRLCPSSLRMVELPPVHSLDWVLRDGSSQEEGR